MGEPPSHLSIGVIGPVSSGKSTLCGRFILTYKGIDKEIEKQYRTQASHYGKEEWMSWILDQQRIERERGHSMENSIWGLNLDEESQMQAHLKSKDVKELRRFTIIDSPGGSHSEKRVHQACAFTDSAVVVLSAVPGEYEGCLDQFRQYAMAAMTAGIKSFVVAVNKMDHQRVLYSKERFDQIEKFVRNFFESRIRRRSGRSIAVVPVSAKTGCNVCSFKNHNSPMSWWNGDTLVAAIAALRGSPKRLGPESIKKPLRFIVLKSFRSYQSGTIAIGRVEAGQLRVGQNVVVSPGGMRGIVNSIQQHYKDEKTANPGDLVGVGLKGIAVRDLKCGFIMGLEEKNSPKTTVSFEAQILVTNQPYDIREGASHVMDIHGAHIPVRLQSIRARQETRIPH
eukprot:jgi/Bigna1/67808/fgenesh1_pg.4_\